MTRDTDFIKGTMIGIALLSSISNQQEAIDELCDYIGKRFDSLYKEGYGDGLIEGGKRELQNQMTTLNSNLNRLIEEHGNKTKPDATRSPKKKTSNRSSTKSKPLGRPRK